MNIDNISAEALRMTTGQLFFYLIGFIPFFICFPIWTVARFIWTPWSKEIMEEIQEKIPYSNMYPYSEDYKDDYKTNYNGNVVIDDTPSGTVIMKYDGGEKVFNYWSNKAVQQEVLETCARKYIKVFQCSEIYHYEKPEEEGENVDEEGKGKGENVDEEDEVEKGEGVEKEEGVEDEESDDGSGVFVKFKAQKEKEKKEKEKEKTPEKEKIINKFLKKGSINDYMMLPKNAVEYAKKGSDEKKLSWSEWLNAKAKSD